MSKVNTAAMDKQNLTAIGLMSGTSLDGVDAALVHTDGEAHVKTAQHIFRAYTDEERAVLVETMRQAVKWNFVGPSPNIFAKAEDIVDAAHVDAITSLLAKTDTQDIDLIGYHGQTVLHHAAIQGQGQGQGQKGATLQIGRGQALADEFGIPTAYDFRSNDVSVGGQGAPLAPVYHKALVMAAGLSGNTAVINIGGVSNVTVVVADGNIAASDCGPGNGPLDSWVSQNGLGEYDKDGVLSLRGTPDIARLEGWLKRPFFLKNVPKSADRYDFDVLSTMHGMSIDNGAATLSMFCALAIQNTLNQYHQAIENIVVCGGGRHNPAIIAALTEALSTRVINCDDLGWDGDALEAQAFAYMAVRHKKRLPLSFPSTTGVSNPVTGGVLATPNK
ncbi:anhydro-N-acetylmuramic acid kinase [Fretibacter rubidus]|uniref:anhydro-N-acetylmuramic acid kinase n=1 Tax=Fretibacter rubidus TaxID=570162 RepID=UPI00352B88EB